MCANDHCDTKTRGANATAVRDRRPGAGRHTSSVIAATSGAVAIGDLRVAAGVSSTHLAQRFKELIGVTPKRLARTYRLASTVLAINPAIPIDWGDLAGGARYFDQAHFRPRVPGVHRPHADPVRRSPAAVPARSSRARLSPRHPNLGAPQSRGEPRGQGSHVRVGLGRRLRRGRDDQPGPLFDWLSSGDVPLDESGELKVSQTSYDYTRPYWDQIGATIVGRHVFDMTNGWDGKPPGGIDHVVVVTHRGRPEGLAPRGAVPLRRCVEAAVAKAQELAGDDS
jgi:hypothetical protein